MRPWAITNSLKAPTITPNFRQPPVMLRWDKVRVASRPGSVRAPDSSAPQPPGARSAGPVEFRVRFNPLMPSGRLPAGSIFLILRASDCSVWGSGAAACRRGAQHQSRFCSHAALHDDIEPVDILKRVIALWNFTQRQTEVFGLAAPVAQLHPATHHIVVGQRLVAILAAPNLHRHFTGDQAEPHLTAAVIIFRSGNAHRHFAVSNGQ